MRIRGLRRKWSRQKRILIAGAFGNTCSTNNSWGNRTLNLLA